MSWKTVRLEDICVSISDGDHQAPPKVNKGIPFITISNIDNLNKIDFSNVMYVPDNYYDGLDTKRKPQKNDILYSVVGTFGKPVYIDNDDKFVFQRHIAILRPNLEKIVPKFLYHIMLSREFYAQADTLAIGAAQRTISLTALRKMKVDIPSLEMQNKITSILAKYDDLIANNNKRIKILEKMAENLYQEWFVRFRFPGYETAEFVDGVPKAWMFKRVEQIGKIVAGGTPSTKIDEYWNGDIPWLTPADLSSFSGIYISRGSIDISELGLRKSSAVMLPTNTVLLSSRAPIGYVALAKNPIATNQGFKSVICNEDTVNCYYLFYFFKMNKSLLESFGSGATFLELSAKGLSRMKILIPSFDIQNKFGKFISKIADEVDMLQQQNQNLIKQRDYLLPRLMSGKLQVK